MMLLQMLLASGSSFLFFLVLIGGVVLIIYVFTYDRMRSAVKNVFAKNPYSDLAKVKNGEYVKIKGTVWDGGRRIIAPLSERTCVYCHIEVLHRVGSGRTRYWDTLMEEEIMGDLILKSGNHFAVIQGDSLITHLVFDKVYTTGFLNSAKGNVERFLKQHGHELTDWIGFNREMELKEGILRRGEEFAVTGRGQWIAASELNFTIPAQKVFLITETKEDRVFLSEDPSLVKPELYKPK